MQEVLIFAVGFIGGTISTGCAVYLGGHLVLRSYLELTSPYPQVEDTNKDKDKDTATTNGGYDWDEYDSYIKPPRDDEGEEPEA